MKRPSRFQDIRGIGTGVIWIRGLLALGFGFWGDDVNFDGKRTVGFDPKRKISENHGGSIKKLSSILKRLM
jgi:hypothetical protein